MHAHEMIEIQRLNLFIKFLEQIVYGKGRLLEFTELLNYIEWNLD